MKVIFSPLAWIQAKRASHFKHEVGAMGIVSAGVGNNIVVERLVFPKQYVSAARCVMDPDDAAEKAIDLYQEGYHPYQVLRFWFHTHPSGHSQPSGEDWDTFERSYGGGDWAVMFILPSASDQPTIWYRQKVENEGYKHTLFQQLPFAVDWEMSNYGEDQISGPDPQVFHPIHLDPKAYAPKEKIVTRNLKKGYPVVPTYKGEEKTQLLLPGFRWDEGQEEGDLKDIFEITRSDEDEEFEVEDYAEWESVTIGEILELAEEDPDMAFDFAQRLGHEILALMDTEETPNA